MKTIIITIILFVGFFTAIALMIDNAIDECYGTANVIPTDRDKESIRIIDAEINKYWEKVNGKKRDRETNREQDS